MASVKVNPQTAKTLAPQHATPGYDNPHYRGKKRTSPNDNSPTKPLPAVTETGNSTTRAPNERPFKNIKGKGNYKPPTVSDEVKAANPKMFGDDYIPAEEGFAENADYEGDGTFEIDEDKNDEDKNDEEVDMITNAERLEHIQRLNNGANARVTAAPEKIPEKIRKMNREYSRHVRQWWANGEIPKSQIAIFQGLQTKVEKICSNLAKEGDQSSRAARFALYKEKYRFPKEEILGHIQTLGLSVRELEGLKEDINRLETVEEMGEEVNQGEKVTKKSHNQLSKEIAQTKKKIIEGALVFTKIIEGHQLEPQLLIPDHYKMLFADLVDESDETKRTHQDFLDQLIAPLEEQEEKWDEIRPYMGKFLEQATDPEGSVAQMQELVKLMKTKNNELISTNSELGVVKSSFSVPITDMDTICKYKGRTQNDKIEPILARWKAMMEMWWATEDIEKFFPAQIAPSLAEKPRLEYQRRLLQITGEKIPESFAPVSAPKSTSPTPPVPDTPPTIHGSNTQTSNKPQSSANLFVPESIGSFDIDTFDLEDDTIQMMLYDDGRTEYGKLEATRPCRTGNVRYSRFIVNAGTEGAPFYKVIKGADLGPGGAETFHDEEWQNLYTQFDLTSRRKAMRDVGGNTIEAIGPCVEMPRESSTRRTKSGKPYRPDLYVRVKYHNEIAKNPLAKTHPTVEWQTRTEFSQLVGKKYAEGKEKVMMAKYKKRQLYFETCKARQLHPETKRSLEESDFEEYPWLFPDDANVGKAGRKAAKKDTEEDIEEDEDLDMDGVVVDGAEDDEDNEL
jgi:hypothetical protein